MKFHFEMSDGFPFEIPNENHKIPFEIPIENHKIPFEIPIENHKIPFEILIENHKIPFEILIENKIFKRKKFLLKIILNGILNFVLIPPFY